MGVRGAGVRALCAGIVVWLVAGGAAGAASAQTPAREVWPEVDVWLRFSPAWRASFFVPVSENLETHYREGNLILQADYAWGQTKRRARLIDENRKQAMKAWLIRGGYLRGRSLDDEGAEYTEFAALVEGHVRLPLKGGVLMSHRLRTDLRWLGAGEQEFSTRWRYRTQVEREFMAGPSSLVPYVNVEAYYDSRYDTVNRVRLITGGSVSWAPRTALETNVTFQYDSRSSVTELFALGVILHIFFDASRAP